MTLKEKHGLKVKLGKCYSSDERRIMEIAKREIDSMPTTVERPHGERKKAHYIKGKNGEWYCSSCKRIDDKYSVARFCWYCGADMRKEGEAE